MSLKQIFGTKQQLKEGFIPTKNEIDIAPELAFLAIAYYSIQSVKYALENMCPHLFEKEEIGNWLTWPVHEDFYSLFCEMDYLIGKLQEYLWHKKWKTKKKNKNNPSL